MKLSVDNAFDLAYYFDNWEEERNPQSLIGEFLFDEEGKFNYHRRINYIIVAPEEKLQEVVKNYFRYEKDNRTALDVSTGSYDYKMSIFLIARTSSSTHAIELERYIEHTGHRKEFFDSLKDRFI